MQENELPPDNERPLHYRIIEIWPHTGAGAIEIADKVWCSPATVKRVIREYKRRSTDLSGELAK